MGRKMNLQEVEALLTERFTGKTCELEIPGYRPVYGIVSSIGIETAKLPEQVVYIMMLDKKYTVSAEALNEALTVLK